MDVGDVCSHFCFINHGSFCQYFVDDELEENITNLFIDNSWVLEHSSFIARKPSKNKIEAFENSEVLSLNIHDLHDLIAKSPSFLSVGKILDIGKNTFTSSNNSPTEKYQA